MVDMGKRDDAGWERGRVLGLPAARGHGLGPCEHPHLSRHIRLEPPPLHAVLLAAEQAIGQRNHAAASNCCPHESSARIDACESRVWDLRRAILAD